MSFVETAQFSRAEALSVLSTLPVIYSHEVGGVVLETRLIGTFVPEVGKRDIPALKAIINTQSLLQDLLTDAFNSPSTTFDSKNGQVTITTRKSILG